MLDRTALIIYDISNNKRRRKVAKVLESYGIRIQESAFECSVTKYSVSAMLRDLNKYLDPDNDKLRIYILNSMNTVHSVGIHPQLPEENVCFI